MDSFKNRKDKVKFLKGVLSGEVSLKETLTPMVYVLYSLAPDMETQYTKAGEVVTEEERRSLEERSGKRPVIFVNIVCTQSKTVFSLPHNYREPITEPIYKTIH